MKSFINQCVQWLKNQPIKKQRRLLIGALIGSIVLILVSTFLFSKSPISNPSIHSHKVKTAIQTLDPKEIWIHHMEYAAKQSEKRIAELEKQLKKLLEEKKANPKKESLKKPLSSTPTETDSPATQLREVLRQQFNEAQPLLQNNSQKNPLETLKPTYLDEIRPFPKNQQLLLPNKINESSERKKQIPTGITHLKMSASTVTMPRLKTTHNTLLANTFAPAILLGSVDALTNLNAASDPKPILLQITGHGQLPRGGQQDLEGCYVSARAYGELPTERVEMRLETLTCRHRKTGAGMEVAVKGYVSGEDGRPGLRGIVVDRAGASIRQIGVAGMLSSLSQFFIRKGSQLPVDTPAFNWQQAEDLLKAGAGHGVGNAFEKLAEFFIKRAERLEPVIQIQAGRNVTVVFTQGIPFEDQTNTPLMPPTTQKNKASSLFSTETT